MLCAACCLPLVQKANLPRPLRPSTPAGATKKMLQPWDQCGGQNSCDGPGKVCRPQQ
jgi:hypothetical protein